MIGQSNPEVFDSSTFTNVVTTNSCCKSFAPSRWAILPRTSAEVWPVEPYLLDRLRHRVTNETRAIWAKYCMNSRSFLVTKGELLRKFPKVYLWDSALSSYSQSKYMACMIFRLSHRQYECAFKPWVPAQMAIKMGKVWRSFGSLYGKRDYTLREFGVSSVLSSSVTESYKR